MKTNSLSPALWHFPLNRTHAGVPFGNGRLGALVWGGGNVLTMTLGRADFWDHRGGFHWTEKQSYANIRSALEANDTKAMAAFYEGSSTKEEGAPPYPTMLPVGRIEVRFDKGYRLSTLALDLASAVATVTLVARSGKSASFTMFCDLVNDTLVLDVPASLKYTVKGVPSWVTARKALEKISYRAPKRLANGWVQECPVDPALAVGWATAHPPKPTHGGRVSSPAAQLRIATARGNTVAEAKACLEKTLAKPVAIAKTRAWWKQYWNATPSLAIPNAELQFAHDFGMYKFAGMTHPDGVPATLQGPWVEDDRLPPWSNDYHFNINVQMCYWPAYRGNHLSHLLPLFAMVRTWWPQLQDNARKFVGIPDGFMLPHSVDDRNTAIGGYWSGTIDHGCTAWVCEMMYRYVQFSGDLDFLRTDAYPFMKGTMKVYQAMFEDKDGTLTLPVSVSPEYDDEAWKGWGRNASFQLACVHRLAADLQEAERLLKLPATPDWADIRKRLPVITTVDKEGKERIAIWEGTDLEHSHRHHSHLGALVPFNVLDPDDKASPHFKSIHNAIVRWINKGQSLWSGWCVPWASMLHTRMGNGDAAEFWLIAWDRIFTNESHASLHDGHVPGLTLFGHGSVLCDHSKDEVMQMDASMSAVAALYEMMVHDICGVHHILRGAPARWRDVSFANLLCKGGVLVSAERVAGKLARVTLRATCATRFTLADPWTGNVRTLPLRKGQTLTLTPKR
ncbi:MAG: glycoside hydrolase N-terminal domain-containing protein [Kiritimatiellaeota bacterium]|nr:glycoside hydrolase N-terminal domain-containing protein [Kiritimatiellota bacterium]